MNEFAHKMDTFLDGYCSRYRYSGILRVTRQDQILYQRCMGYSDWEAKIPMEMNHHFTLYSLSKPFCAIGLLLLVDQGLVSLDAHPSEYVPEACKFDSRVTIRSMLNHTSGMPDFGTHASTLGIPEVNWYGRARELMNAVSAFSREFEPETATQYANVNFTLAALIIENVSGMHYGDYMCRNVFEPLGMKHAYVDYPGKFVTGRAVGYDFSGDHLIRADADVSWMLGAGDILATVDDVYCLNRAVKYQKLLKPETWKQVLTTSPVNNFGFGCTVTNWHGKKRITHNGGHVGFRTLHIQLPDDDFDIILLSNCGFGDSRNSISEAVYKAFYGSSDVESQRIEMDAGYIREIVSVGHDDTSIYKLSAEKEASWLGEYEKLSLRKHEFGYAIEMRNGQLILCDYIGNGVFENRYIDERYRVLEEAGIVTLMGSRKLP